MSESKEHEQSPSKPEPAGSAEPNRRAFVAVCAAGTCAVVATIGVPAALFVAAPLGEKAGEGKKFAVAKLAELEVGVPKKFTLVGDEIDAWTRATGRRLGAVWLMRTGDREVRALSTTCPHLGCSINYIKEAKRFVCPCHNGTFDLHCQRVSEQELGASNPAPRGMDSLDLRLAEAPPLPDGKPDFFIEVKYQNFRQGEHDKVPKA